MNVTTISKKWKCFIIDESGGRRKSAWIKSFSQPSCRQTHVEKKPPARCLFACCYCCCCFFLLIRKRNSTNFRVYMGCLCSGELSAFIDIYARATFTTIHVISRDYSFCLGIYIFVAVLTVTRVYLLCRILCILKWNPSK